MAMKAGRRSRGARGCCLALLALLLAAAFARPARAEDAPNLYQATAIVTGTDMRSRPSGFAQCLREVLVKLSGEPRLRNDPRVLDLAAHADAFVTSFDYVDLMAGIPRHDDQGTYDRPHSLSVRFDPARIDSALAGLGEHPWRGERPVIVPVLFVHGPAGAYLLSAEVKAGAEQRQSFAVMADEYAMRVRVPTAAELAAWGVTGEGFPQPHAASAPQEALVAGTLAFEEALPGWVGSWRMRWRGTDYEWGIRGVNYDEAFRDIVRGVVRVASGHGKPD
ncbi:MAG TPA: DUF2066 domain-containing protein [Stellaceae bacterium]|nr:DUF2066 domain-containing protein [Stellaceae bacterium]